MTDGGIENLGRWITIGVVAGAIVVGIAIAAYAVGYHRGQHHGRTAGAATTAAATTATTTQAAPTTATVTVTPALVGRGKQLYTADSCAGCHSLTGAAGAGPTFKGLAGSAVALDNGQTVTADDAYLARSITDPDAEIVKGYHSGLMGPAIAGFHLSTKTDDVDALVAFIKSQT